MTTRLELKPTTVLVKAPGALSTSLPDETVILDPASGRYFGLSGVGARAWALLSASTTWSNLLAMVNEEYEVDHGRAERDLLALMEDLARRGLIVINGAGD